MINNWGNYTQSTVYKEYRLPIFVSYHTPVGIIRENSKIMLVSERKYSSTTQRQINRYCKENGLTKITTSHENFNKHLDDIGCSKFRGRA